MQSVMASLVRKKHALNLPRLQQANPCHHCCLLILPMGAMETWPPSAARQAAQMWHRRLQSQLLPFPFLHHPFMNLKSFRLELLQVRRLCPRLKRLQTSSGTSEGPRQTRQRPQMSPGTKETSPQSAPVTSTSRGAPRGGCSVNQLHRRPVHRRPAQRTRAAPSCRCVLVFASLAVAGAVLPFGIPLNGRLLSLLQAAEGGVEPRARLRCVCAALRSLRPWLALPCVARSLRSLRSRPWPLAVHLLDLYCTTLLRGSSAHG